MKRNLPVLAILLAAVLAGGWWYTHAGAGAESSVFSGTMEARQILAGSKVGGRVVEVLVEEGTIAKAGDPLVRFDVRDLAAQRRQLEARAAEAQAAAAKLQRGFRPEERDQAAATARQHGAQLEALRRGPRQQEIAQAESDLRAAEADLQHAKTTYERAAALAATGDLSRQALDDAGARRAVQEARTATARERLKLLRAGTRAEDIRAQEARLEQASAQARLMESGYQREDIAAARARLDQIQAQIAELDVRLSEGEIRAPADCVVEVVSARPGDMVPAGRPVVTLLEPSQLWVRVFVPESRLGLIKVGQKMEVEAMASPGRWYPAHIEQIASQGEFLPRNVQTRDDRDHLVYAVKVRLDAADHPLKAGMAANARLVGSR